MPEESDPALLSDEALAVAIQTHRRAALRGSGYLAQRGDALERELRRRAGIVSEFGAPLRFADSRRRPWWRFW